MKSRNRPTTSDQARFTKLVELGCIIKNRECEGRITIHHCFTGMGRRKCHSKTTGLCWRHHLGDLGIDGKQMGKRTWELIYGSEEVLLERVNQLINNNHE